MRVSPSRWLHMGSEKTHVVAAQRGVEDWTASTDYRRLDADGRKSGKSWRMRKLTEEEGDMCLYDLCCATDIERIWRHCRKKHNATSYFTIGSERGWYNAIREKCADKAAVQSITFKALVVNKGFENTWTSLKTWVGWRKSEVKSEVRPVPPGRYGRIIWTRHQPAYGLRHIRSSMFWGLQLHFKLHKDYGFGK